MKKDYLGPKYIVVTGGVISGVGKGLATASIGKILQHYGYKVTAIKIDPYLNYDAGTLRPTEHGEVWVTDDGGEIDLDLGNYERFLGLDLPRLNNLTTGQIYKTVIERERRGEYLGQTVQPIPHITDEIKRRVTDAANGVVVLMYTLITAVRPPEKSTRSWPDWPVPRRIRRCAPAPMQLTTSSVGWIT